MANMVTSALVVAQHTLNLRRAIDARHLLSVYLKLYLSDVDLLQGFWTIHLDCSEIVVFYLLWWVYCRFC
jgi:hypothetical protein